MDCIVLSFNKTLLASPVVQLPAAEDHPTAQALHGVALQFRCVPCGPLHTSLFKDAAQKFSSSKIQVGDKRSGMLHPQVCLHLQRLSYTMVGAFNPHTASLGLPSQTTWLWIFPLPKKYPLLEMASYQEIERKLHGLLADLGDLTVQGFLSLRKQRAVMGPSEWLNPGGT